MKWFKDLRKGQKVLLLIDAVIFIVSFILIFSGVGNDEMLIFAVLITIINCISIVISRSFFKFGIWLEADNVGDDVEPSDLKYLYWYISWGSMVLVSIALIVLGFVIGK
jgi:uncharacterized membrane protein AbrB (regulator of aidB expression)